MDSALGGNGSSYFLVSVHFLRPQFSCFTKFLYYLRFQVVFFQLAKLLFII